MILRACAALAALCLSAGAAQAQTIAEMNPETPGQTAAILLRGFCLPMFDATGFSVEKATLAANDLGLMPVDGLVAVGPGGPTAGFAAPSPPGTTTAVLWATEEGACQIQITGPDGAGLDLIAAMPDLGWMAGPQGRVTEDGTAVDLFYTQNAAHAVLLASSERWIESEAPEGALRLTLTIARVE